jgi:hypothetical protein
LFRACEAIELLRLNALGFLLALKVGLLAYAAPSCNPGGVAMGAWRGLENEQADGAVIQDDAASRATHPVRLDRHEPEATPLDIQVAIEWAHLGGG